VAAVMIAGVAHAADMRAPAYKVPPPVAVWSWTGFYVGAHVGAGWGNKWWDSTGQTPFIAVPPAPQDIGHNFGTTSVDGFLGGFQVGFNYQTGPLVWGVEADWSWTNMKGQFNCPAVGAAAGPPIVGPSTCSSKIEWIATVVGRIGVTVDRALVYVGGGAAWAHEKDHYSCTDLDCGAPVTAVLTWDGNNTKTGWTFLTGVEYAIWSNWSAKIQYNFYQFDDNTVHLTPNQIVGCLAGGCAEFDITTRLRIHSIKAGLNYRFDWTQPPIAARY
jgi:outer membrane immunogenic protein